MVAEADAKRFLTQMETASKSPRVFRENLYLGTLASALTDTRKYIVPTSASNEVIQLNFEESGVKGLFDLTPGSREEIGIARHETKHIITDSRLALVAALFVLLQILFTVHEGQAAVVTTFGKPVRSITEAGALHPLAMAGAAGLPVR